jgi:hypothetical protein
MVAKERGRAGHPDESIQAAGVRKKILTDLLQGHMTPAEKDMCYTWLKATGRWLKRSVLNATNVAIHKEATI